MDTADMSRVTIVIMTGTRARNIMEVGMMDGVEARIGNPCQAVNMSNNHSIGAAMQEAIVNRCRNRMESVLAGGTKADIGITIGTPNRFGESLKLDTNSQFNDPFDRDFEVFDGAAGVVG